ALRTHAPRRGPKDPARGPATTGLGLRGLLLGDGHLLSFFSFSSDACCPGLPRSASRLTASEGVERCPPGVDRLGLARAARFVAVDAADRAQPEAPLGAEGNLGQLQQHSVARQRLQVELVPTERVGLLGVSARQRRHSPAQGAVTEPVARIPPCTDSSTTSTTTMVPSGTQLPVTARSGMGPSRRSRRLAPGWRRRVATLTTNGCWAIFLAPVS